MEGEARSRTPAKYSTDFLSKVWKPLASLTPFYSGGKISSTLDGNDLCCLHNSQIHFFSLHDTLQLKRTLAAENEEITAFCFAPNGKTLATFSKNLLLRQWSSPTWDCETTIRGHKMPVLSMDYDQSCTLVATGSTDHVVRVWDMVRGFCTHSFKYHHDLIRFVKFLPNCKEMFLFSSSDDCTLKTYNLMNSTCIGDFTNHLSAPTDIALTDENEIIVSVGRDKVLNFYRLRSTRLIKSLVVFEELEAVVLIASSTDPQSRKRKQILDNISYIVITAGERGILKFFRLEYQAEDIEGTFSCIPLSSLNIDDGILIDHSSQSQASSGVTSLRYFRESQRLMVTTFDNRIIFYSLADSIPISITQVSQYVGSFDDILGISIVPDLKDDGNFHLDDSALLPLVRSTRIAVVSNSSVVHLLDHATSSNPLVGHTDIVLAVQSSPDGKWIVTSSKDCSCRLWSTSTSKCVAIATGHTDAVSSIALSHRLTTYSSNCAIFASGGGDKVLKRWRLLSEFDSNSCDPIMLSSSHSVRAHDKDINTIAISPNDALIATGSHDTRIRLWNSQDLEAIVTLVGHRKSVWCVRFSPVDKCLASSSGDRTLKLWSLVDYTCLRTLQGHTASVLCLQFVRHGMQIVSAAADGLLYLWTIRTGERENVLDKHIEKVWGLEKLQLNDAEILISCGSDSQIISWYDATPEEEQLQLESQEKTMIMEQQLTNFFRLKKYSEALDVAFDLKYPNKILQILQAISIENSQPLQTSSENCLNRYTRKWSSENITQILNYIKEWNTNSRHSKIVHLLFQSLIEIFGVSNFLNLPSLADSLLSLSSYTERHFQRVDKLNESIYLLEYLDSESSLSPSNEIN